MGTHPIFESDFDCLTEKEMSKPAPKPKLTAKPKSIKVFTATWGYQAQADDELTFEEGDILYVSNMDGDWWKGTCGGKTGMIPANYLQCNEEGEGGEILFPLHEAAKRGNVNWAKECLDNKLSINGQDKSGATALYWASYGGHIELARLLLQNQYCDLNIQNKLGDTALIAASYKGHADLVDLLVQHGAQVDIANNAGDTARKAATEASVIASLQNALGEVHLGNKAGYGDENSSSDED